jgi:hypothetical protein
LAILADHTIIKVYRYIYSLNKKIRRYNGKESTVNRAAGGSTYLG